MDCSNCIYNENIYEDGYIILNRPPSTVVTCRLGFPIQCQEGRNPKELERG